MDSGLAVRWPLSPFATALAAGALFAFCVALWKQRSGPKQHPGAGGESGNVVDVPRFGGGGRREESRTGSVTWGSQPLVERDRNGKQNLELPGSFSHSSRTVQDSPEIRNRAVSRALESSTDESVNPKSVSSDEIKSITESKSLKKSSDLFPRCVKNSQILPVKEIANIGFLLNIIPHFRPFVKRLCQTQRTQLHSDLNRNFSDFVSRPNILTNSNYFNEKPLTRAAISYSLEKEFYSVLGRYTFTRQVEKKHVSRALSPLTIPDDSENVDDKEDNVEAAAGGCVFEVPAEKVDRALSPVDFQSYTLNTSSNFQPESLHYQQKEITFATIKALERSDILRNYDENSEENVTDCPKNIELNSNIKFLKSDNSRFSETSEVGVLQFTNSLAKRQNESQEKIMQRVRPANRPYDSKVTETGRECSSLNTKGDLFFVEKESVSKKKIVQAVAPDLSPNNSKAEEYKQLSTSRKERARQVAEKKELYSKNIHTLNESKFDDARRERTAKTRAERTDNHNFGTAAGKSAIKNSRMNFAERENLDRFQNAFDNKERELTPQKTELSFALETRQSIEVGGRGVVEPYCPPESSKTEEKQTESGFRETPLDRDVSARRGEREGLTSRVAEEKESRLEPRQMDRRSGERSVGCSEQGLPPARVFESSVTSETKIHANGDARVSTAVVSRLTFEEWSEEGDAKRCNGIHADNSPVVRTVEEKGYRPTFEEFVPERKMSKESIDDTIEQLNEIAERSPRGKETTPPRANRLMGLLSRDEERRARAQFLHIKPDPPGASSSEGEWDRLLRDVLASVSELERWEANEQRRRCGDVSGGDADANSDPRHHLQSDSSSAMEEEAVLSPKGETPTKVKNLRFKLDPDVFDVPSDDSFYDDDDDEGRRPSWRKQSKYRAFSTLELNDEPVRLVSVHASVVPAGQKMVARPVGIDLRVRLTEERQSKRAHVGTSPSQAKRRSPVSDRGVGWCQELSPVTENVDWRETFSSVPQDTNVNGTKTIPNGILKTPSPKSEPVAEDSANPFKNEVENVTNDTKNPVTAVEKRTEKPTVNGAPWKPPRKPFVIPRKKFEPDPEAIERITGYKTALSKPPLPPPAFHKVVSNISVRSRAEQARKQYLDSKSALSSAKVDGARKFQQFLAQAQSDRAKIVISVPDLGAIERAVSEQWEKERAPVSPRASPARDDNQKTEDVPPSRGSTPDDAWVSYVQSCRRLLGRRSQSLSYLETEIDISVLDDDDKCRSTSALDEPDNEEDHHPVPDESDLDHSREDLDDSGRAKSEHELRVERSLRNLPLPDWYRRSDKTKTGFLLGAAAKEKRGWAAAKSLASSTSSLASCGVKRPVRSLRSSRENIPWSRSSASPDGPSLSLALAKAFREPYLGWRARTPTSSGVSSSPRASPPSWGAVTTDDEVNGISFDGEDAFGRTSSEEDKRDEPPSLDDTGADAVTVSMDTGDPVKLPGGEDTCDDINNMSMDTCELFDSSIVPEADDPSPQADTGDDIDNLSTDTTDDRGRDKDSKLKRYSYSQSIYHSEWDDEESRGDRKSSKEEHESSPSSEHNKVIWIESSFVGSRTTTSIVVMPKDKTSHGSVLERPASR